MAPAMHHEMTLLIADRQQNDFMAGFDLRPAWKWYVRAVKVTFDADSVTDDYFIKLIAESKNCATFWIPGIRYMTNYFVDPSVKSLSDGKYEFFVRRE